MGGPRIVLYDIETTHNVVATFRLRDDNAIPHENILQERYIVCAAWKTLGEARVRSCSVLNDRKRYARNPHDDRHVVETLRAALESADVIVAHYGNAYDRKYLETRMLYHGMQPLAPVAQVDTYRVAKRKFLFNSNRLDYLGQFLKVGRKKPTTSGLWLRILQGDKAAIREMVEYNAQDVELLERVFKKLQPHIPDHVNRQLFGDIGCPRCGSLKTIKEGYHQAITRRYQRYKCQACGGWFRDVKAASTGTPSRVL